MAASELWAVEMVVAAFAGGAFGAAVGALPAFSLAGAMVVVGETYALARASIEGATLPAVPITDAIGFGVVLGPHVSFGGGAAALAYAARRGYLDTGFEYHPAKEVTRGLGARADVLLVGGAFGVFGYWVATASATLGAPWDPVAVGVVVSAFAHRAAFGYSLLGEYDGSPLDMSSAGRDGSSVEPWLPYQHEWADVTLLGLVVGVLGAYVAYLTASPFLAFGISVAALVFLNAGVAGIPVTHHMSLPASTVVVAMAGAPATPAALAAALPLWRALLAGALLGAVGALAGELLQRLLYAHAETHLDPPAASIVVTTFLLAVLAAVGVLPGSAWIPLP